MKLGTPGSPGTSYICYLIKAITIELQKKAPVTIFRACLASYLDFVYPFLLQEKYIYLISKKTKWTDTFLRTKLSGWNSIYLLNYPWLKESLQIVGYNKFPQFVPGPVTDSTTEHLLVFSIKDFKM